ncbi:MAG: DNA polymerase ligase N-terminal domain-containing protein [Candidatus Thorarchaeota archaeon]
MAKKDPLEEYQKKRDFRKTIEPSGRRKKKSKRPLFVIQKHDASRLHYDFRLEVDGVLKSWAIPKGPSTKTKDKRLAILTEDHPLDYADFEGIIPEGEYGAGTVLVWDIGTYRNLRAEKEDDDASMGTSIKEGKVEIWLKGKKIRGGHALIRTGKEKDSRWLLIKMDDPEADARRNPVSTEPKSVLTGRTIDQIARQEKLHNGEIDRPPTN